MEKVWLKSYPPMVASVINPDIFASLNEVFEEACQKYGPQQAFSNWGNTLSYKAWFAKAQDFASYLQNELHLKPGDRFAIMLPNLIQYPVAIMGAWLAGLVVVNINPLYTARELEVILKDAEPKVLLVLENFASVVEKAGHDITLPHIIVSHMGDMFAFPKNYIFNYVVRHVKHMVPPYILENCTFFTQALKKGRHTTYSKPMLRGDDIALLQYTGGTTGIPKGAMLTHRNMIANTEQVLAWLAPFVKMGEETIVTALPLYHVFSLTANLLVFLRLGAKNILITNPKDIPAFIKQLKGLTFTAFTGVNTLFNALANHPKFANLDFSKLRIVVSGGMALQKKVAERWLKVTRVVALEAYGLTEASPAICINPINTQDFNGSIGLPLPNTDVSIRNEFGQELPTNSVGELWARGPQIMKGYWNNPSETQQVLNVDGWLKTGDIAVIDERGFVSLVDRKKDLILVSGFNVYPNEVEGVIALMASVLEVAVVGVDNEMRGEIVKAFIVKKQAELTKEQILAHCRENLTSYKVPKEIEFVKELPKSTIGKILRRALKNPGQS